MTTIRVSGPKDELGPIIERIKAAFPEIVSEKTYDSDREEGILLVYFNIEEELQKRAKANLEDWTIIEYCHERRGTSEIMRYFNLEYDTAKEILDRLAQSGALVRDVYRKSYYYLDSRKAVYCKDCARFDPEKKECVDGSYRNTDSWEFPGYCRFKPIEPKE